MKTHPIASRQEWEAARSQLLAKEKGLTPVTLWPPSVGEYRTRT
jgi:predicted dithiol-disulfide oxidoreductase (DUF899 family)